MRIDRFRLKSNDGTNQQQNIYIYIYTHFSFKKGGVVRPTVPSDVLNAFRRFFKFRTVPEKKGEGTVLRGDQVESIEGDRCPFNGVSPHLRGMLLTRAFMSA